MKTRRSLVFTKLASRLGLVAGLLLLPALTGCVVVAAGAAGAGAVAYVRGELQSTVGNEYGRVVEATREALNELEFVKISESKDALKAMIVYRTALDKKVEVNLAKIDDKSTKVEIRIGLLGDQAMSTLILEKIKAHL